MCQSTYGVFTRHNNGSTFQSVWAISFVCGLNVKIDRGWQWVAVGGWRLEMGDGRK
ncbi:hypothetical protein BofuT4_uP025680.1 [Botrytis cinerea T4]|uniref:Uncharacterized protein n=1 Tax=Botryotinia fuckeliana (strain T4) TaxID=999810 RepID=G2YEH1_BOTF4|nr:hypothetical protein BofuT4_uP025680.1 [Botrytis cinerea T4]